MTAQAMDYVSERHNDSLTILILEDNADVRESLKLLLELRGALVVAAGTAREALALLRKHRPDVIVSDIGLPGENGLSFIQRVRALPASAGGNVPAIALTAYSHLLKESLAAGFQAGLEKPADPAILLNLIERLASADDASEPALRREDPFRYTRTTRFPSPGHWRH